MAEFGYYGTLRAASSDIIHDEAIKKKPAHEVFAYLAYKNMSAEIQYKTEQEMIKQNKPKSK